MPEFFYRAKNLEGKEERGTLITKDVQSLSKILQEKGYFLIEAFETETEKLEKKTEEKLNFFDTLFKVPLTEKIFFSRNLAVMLASGISFSKALFILKDQVQNKKFKFAISRIAERVNKGESFSQALKDYNDIFPPFYYETIKVGEETGNIETILNNLADQMEREYNLLSDVKSAMMYPLIILLTLIGIGIFMVVFTIPKLKVAFENLNVQLPLTTKIILEGADLLFKKWYLVFIFLAILTVPIYFIFKSQKGKKIKDKIAISIPVWSKISKQTNVSVTLRMLSSLLNSGVPIVRSLEIVSGAIGNIYYKNVFDEAKEVIQKGGNLAQVFKEHEDLFYPIVTQMVEVGQESGETPSILSKLADFYEVEVERQTKRLSSIIEPILILIVGGIVGFFAISMLQPMFSIMRGIGPQP